MIELKVIRESEAFLALGNSWRELLHHYPNRNLFLTHAWFYHWWINFGTGKALRVILFYIDEKLVGIAPLLLYKDRMRGMPVTVLGTFFNIHISRTDFIVLPEYQTAISTKLAEYLVETIHEWDVLMLRQMSADSPYLAALSSASKHLGLLPCAPQPGIGKCFLPIESSWDGYLKARSKHFRKRLKEQCRRTEKRGALVYRISNDPNIEDADFKLLRDMESRSWKVSDEFAAMSEEDWHFQKAIALSRDDGISWRNAFMELDGKAIAAIHTISYNNTVYAFQMTFDESLRDAYPGRSMFKYLLETTWQLNEFTYFDFNGNSPFCRSWTDHEHQFVDLQIYNTRPYSRILNQMKRLSRWMKR